MPLYQEVDGEMTRETPLFPVDGEMTVVRCLLDSESRESPLSQADSDR